MHYKHVHAATPKRHMRGNRTHAGLALRGQARLAVPLHARLAYRQGHVLTPIHCMQRPIQAAHARQPHACWPCSAGTGAPCRSLACVLCLSPRACAYADSLHAAAHPSDTCAATARMPALLCGDRRALPFPCMRAAAPLTRRAICPAHAHARADRARAGCRRKSKAALPTQMRKAPQSTEPSCLSVISRSIPACRCARRCIWPRVSRRPRTPARAAPRDRYRSRWHHTSASARLCRG
jgi:hypothetical protein